MKRWRLIVLTIAAAGGFLTWLAVPRVSGGFERHEAAPALSHLRQLALILGRYAIETGEYPEKISDLPEGGLVGAPELEIDPRNVHYMKPPRIPEESDFIMLVLPTKNGVAIAYSDASVEFIKRRK